jgi:hypothetical protein
MLDWYTINYLYPKSFERFSNVMFPNVGVVSLSTLEFYDAKKLYQFFDKEGVYLNVEMYNPHQWVFSVSLSNGIVFGPTQESKKNREDVVFDGKVQLSDEECIIEAIEQLELIIPYKIKSEEIELE